MQVLSNIAGVIQEYLLFACKPNVSGYHAFIGPPLPGSSVPSFDTRTLSTALEGDSHFVVSSPLSGVHYVTLNFVSCGFLIFKMRNIETSSKDLSPLGDVVAPQYWES